jgi:hypothetical protein
VTYIPTWNEYLNGAKFIISTKGAEMAKLEYNKDEANNSSSPTVTRVPGTWQFAVVDAELRTANSGTKGINVTMEVNQEGNILKAFDTFWLSEKALFRLKAAADACGQALPDEDTDMIGWTGKADFGIDEKGYFEVKRYINAGNADSAPKPEGHNFDGASAEAW